jgi:hypothetical protein
MNSFTTSFKVDRSPDEVFAAINNVRGWWAGKITGESRAVGDQFTYRYEDIHLSKQKVTELVPGRKVVWTVTDANLSSFENKAEWNGTEIRFEIVKAGKETEVRFTHDGLLPSCQCYSDCSGAWTFLVTDSLKKLITTGKGSKFS